MPDFRSSIPFREITLIANNDKDVYFSFADLNQPVPRGRYLFPPGTSFRLRTDDDDIDIEKDGDLADDRWVRFVFVPADTAMVTRDTRVYYEIDAFIPKSSQAVQSGSAGGNKQYTLQIKVSSASNYSLSSTSRHTVLRGYILISAHKNLNEGS
jgi:hypothetical protein